MELYKELAALRCFTRDDAVRLAGSESAAAHALKRYLQKGYVERVRRDLYAAIDLETGWEIPSRYEIASRVTEDACLSHHSAFEYYGCHNQIYFEVYFFTAKRVRPFVYAGVKYYPVAARGNVGVVETDKNIRVTSMERTVIDGIADFNKKTGLEELLRCLIAAPPLDCDKLLEALAMYGRGQLYQRAGYLLEALREDTRLPERFFAECEKRSSASKAYLFEKREDFVLHKRWKLYAPKDLMVMVNKGMDLDAFY